MQKDKEKNVTDCAQIAWELFKANGNLGYYMLYKKLKEEEDKNPLYK